MKREREREREPRSMKTDVPSHIMKGCAKNTAPAREAGRATGKALGDADYGEERDKRKEVRGKRPLDRIPEQPSSTSISTVKGS